MKVTLREVSMAFDNVLAVDNLNLEVNEGELVTFLGPSGCGKSTTLFLIAGIYRPLTGKIQFGDKEVTQLEPEEREIGMVFQNYALYPHMTVLKNILFPLKMRKTPKNEALQQVEEMAGLVGINDLLHRKPSQLSGGQQQRVAIARALVKKPKILLLDEPLSNLDARLRIETREEIRRIQKEVGITTIFVTHDQEEALSISDKILLMKNGRCQQYGTPEKLYTEPTNLFSAAFLGNPPINKLDGVVDLCGNIKIEDLDIVLKNTSFVGLGDNERIKLGVRPEDFFVVDKEEDFDIKGTITLIERVGKDLIVKVASKQYFIRCIFSSDLALEIGDEIYLKIKTNKMHTFHYNTEISYKDYCWNTKEVI